MWTGLILAGGRSTRMGRDKALLRLAGHTLLSRAVSTVLESGGVPLVIGPPRDVPGLAGVRREDEGTVDGDRHGPLQALRHGLRLCGTGVAVALACDLPLVPPALLRFLAAEASRHAAVVPLAAGELQVLSAGYLVAPCLEAIDRRGGTGAVHAFLRDVDLQVIDEPELVRFGGAGIFLNVNSTGDLARAEAILGEGGA